MVKEVKLIATFLGKNGKGLQCKRPYTIVINKSSVTVQKESGILTIGYRSVQDFLKDWKIDY